MQHKEAPGNYEELIRVIHERFDDMSKSYKQIATYLTQNPNEIAMKPVNAISVICGIHSSSFVRFAQALGFSGFKELQNVFIERLSTAAPGFEARLKILETEMDSGADNSGKAFLHELVMRDIASLEELLVSIDSEQLTEAVDLMENADTIYLIGQLRSEPIVLLFRYILTMLGRKTVLLDASGGLATHVAKVIEPGDMLLAVSFRFYATEVVNVAEEVASRGIPILAITDSTLSPLAKNASILFAVPEHKYTFSRSLAAPICLAQVIIMGLAARLQKNDKDPRIPTVTQP